MRISVPPNVYFYLEGHPPHNHQVQPILSSIDTLPRLYFHLGLGLADLASYIISKIMTIYSFLTYK